MGDRAKDVELCRMLANKTSASIDTILFKVKLTHEQYRAVYPDTKVSPGLAIDVCEAQQEEGLTLQQLKKRYNLSDSQLHYTLYNDEALIEASTTLANMKSMIYVALLKKDKTQTQIAIDCGVSQGFVHSIARENNLLSSKRKKRVVLTDKQKECVKQAVRAGEHVDELAKKYGVHIDTIYKQLRG